MALGSNERAQAILCALLTCGILCLILLWVWTIMHACSPEGPGKEDNPSQSHMQTWLAKAQATAHQSTAAVDVSWVGMSIWNPITCLPGVRLIMSSAQSPPR